MRVLPWWHDHARRNPESPLNDCATCMDSQPAHIRQLVGCGFEPALEGSDPWTPPGGAHGTDVAVTTCPGYTTAHLPEVFEVLRARAHWKNGQLATFCGDAPTENMNMAIEVLDGSVAQFEHWKMVPADEGGGRE